MLFHPTGISIVQYITSVQWYLTLLHHPPFSPSASSPPHFPRAAVDQRSINPDGGRSRLSLGSFSNHHRQINSPPEEVKYSARMQRLCREVDRCWWWRPKFCSAPLSRSESWDMCWPHCVFPGAAGVFSMFIGYSCWRNVEEVVDNPTLLCQLTNMASLPAW